MIQNSPPQDLPFSDKIWKNFSRRVDSKKITVILGLEGLKHFYPFNFFLETLLYFSMIDEVISLVH